MKKRRNYIWTAIVIAIVFMVGVIFNIKGIRSFYASVFLAHLTTLEVIIPAALAGFVFLGNKNYWLIVLGCALLVSIFIQLVVVGNGFVTYVILARAAAFMMVVYILNFIKVFTNR